jgi:DNA-binding NtrC family response regulator
LHGLRVLAAASPNEAISLGRRHKSAIDLLVTDVVMPQMSGPQLATEILNIHPEAKLLYMSGYADHPAIKPGTEERKRVFLQKPFSPEALTNAIEKLLTA